MTDEYAAYEEAWAVQLLEGLGYIVRRPEQASFPVVARVHIPDGDDPYRRVTVVVDTEINERKCAVRQCFHAGQLVEIGRALPDIMTRELSRFMAESLRPAIDEALTPRLAALGGNHA
jgi:hypothetical protein